MSALERLILYSVVSVFGHVIFNQVTSQFHSMLQWLKPNLLLTFLGTNNARLAQMLRQLAVYHSKDANNLFCVRLAQGLCHLGKGTLTVCPYHSDRQILSPVACAGILSVLIGCLDVKNGE